MIPHLFYSQLVVWGLLWFCVMRHAVWPSRGAGSQPRPAEAEPIKPKRQRSNEPQPFTGLTHQPPCALCAQEAAYPQAPPPVPPYGPPGRRGTGTRPWPLSRVVAPPLTGRGRRQPGASWRACRAWCRTPAGGDGAPARARRPRAVRASAGAAHPAGNGPVVPASQSHDVGGPAGGAGVSAVRSWPHVRQTHPSACPRHACADGPHADGTPAVAQGAQSHRRPCWVREATVAQRIQPRGLLLM